MITYLQFLATAVNGLRQGLDQALVEVANQPEIADHKFVQGKSLRDLRDLCHASDEFACQMVAQMLGTNVVQTLMKTAAGEYFRQKLDVETPGFLTQLLKKDQVPS